MSKLRDLTGQQLGMLQVIERAKNDKKGNAMWRCRCDCGKEKVIMSYSLVSGKTKSCGCIQKEFTSKRSKTHGKTRTRIYRIWQAMKKRCANPNDSGYRHYGEKGISVCEEWQIFKPFYEWSMGNGYADNLSIDRKDNSAGYEPLNCRWVTNKIQANNKSNNRLLTYKGKTQTLTMWANEIKIPRQRLLNRVRNGWSIEQALNIDKRVNRYC